LRAIFVVAIAEEEVEEEADGVVVVEACFVSVIAENEAGDEKRGRKGDEGNES
jgi:hypothetical protein